MYIPYRLSAVYNLIHSTCL
uniref:Uncharacterized protein n=1 Tax=Anguilla anguilla TaxID=7936 RepID=A0A0E9QDU7_ANGAN